MGWFLEVCFLFLADIKKRSRFSIATFKVLVGFLRLRLGFLSIVVDFFKTKITLFNHFEFFDQATFSGSIRSTF